MSDPCNALMRGYKWEYGGAQNGTRLLPLELHRQNVLIYEQNRSWLSPGLTSKLLCATARK